MKLCEIFYSVQGEGPHMGEPAIFIRFFGCNLACTFCDTKFSWHPDYAEYKEFSVEKVVTQILKYPASRLVFTGGEPTLFQREIRSIRSHLIMNNKIDQERERQWKFELETNGSQKIEDDFWETINISPKTKNSGNKPYEIKACNAPKKTFWKFVVDSKLDMIEILELQKKYNIPSEKILLMSQAQTRPEIEGKSPLVLELCKKYDFRFCPRLHIWLYSDKKGV